MRWSSSHLVALSSLTPPWLVLVFVCAFARSSTAAPVVVSVTAQQCGTQFTDTASSALIADIVLEGRVREKVPVHHHNHNHNNSPLGEGEGVTGRRDMYNAVIQIRKHIWKGKDRIQHKKLHIGKFSSSLDNTDQASNVVTALRPEGDSGAVRDGDSCVGDVADGATYIFFLRDVGDEKGKYFELSALPVKRSRREARIVAKVLTDNGAEAPTIQQLKAPKTVTTGASLTLRCKAKAKPNPVFQWFLDGKEITSGRGQRIKSSKRGSRLKINKAETEHAGVYSCVATNAVGDAGKNITVKVRGFHYEPAAQTSPLPQYTTEVQTTVYDHHMNEDANASADSSVKEEEKIYKACEKQTFCFNGGTCRYIQEMQQSFCQCPAQWAGPRCERLDHHSLSEQYSREATLLYERTLIIVGIVIAVFVFVVICIASYCLANRRRKRFEAKRRLRHQRQEGPEGDALLHKTSDGPGSLGGIQPQFTPSYRPLAQKETQTDPMYHPPDSPPKRQHESEPNFSHPNNIFLRDNSFPLMNAATATQPAAPPPYANGQRPMSAQHHVERRGSRSRLKAVSVDNNCKDRPKSWKPSEVPDSKSMPAIADGNSRVALDMGNSPRRSQTGLPDTGHSEESPRRGEPGYENPMQGEARDEIPWGGEARDESPWNTEDLAAPVMMETPSKANAHAQLKTPAVRGTNSGPAKLFQPGEDFSSPHPAFAAFPVNGVLQDSSDEDDEVSPLPPLHISEEDLNGNVAKRNDQSACRPLPPPPAYRPKGLPDQLDDSYVPTFGVGYSPRSVSEEDSTGFQPLALNNSQDVSPSASEATPLCVAYAFDPCNESDPELDDQFMHGSPKKSVYGGADDKQDYERRLRNVRTDQEAIPI